MHYPASNDRCQKLAAEGGLPTSIDGVNLSGLRLNKCTWPDAKIFEEGVMYVLEYQNHRAALGIQIRESFILNISELHACANAGSVNNISSR